MIVEKTFAISTFAASLNVLGLFSGYIGSILNAIPQITQNGLYAEKVIGIMNNENKIQKFAANDFNEDDIEEITTSFKSIEFRNVSFRYPGSDTDTINNLSFKLSNKEKIALVGENGAGKTTIIKLIMRLYDPSEGEILLNETNIKDINPALYRKLFYAVFQDFQIYAYSLGENIMMRRVTPDDDASIDNALNKSELSNFKEKKNVCLTKEFDTEGIVPSGGQAQKIAVARALANPGAVMIMDEASSALDPISEYNINHSIFENSQNNSMIIISHRLSTVQQADRILYLENRKHRRIRIARRIDQLKREIFRDVLKASRKLPIK